MYGIYTNIGGILMVNVTIYSIHGSYGIWYIVDLLIELGDILRLKVARRRQPRCLLVRWSVCFKISESKKIWVFHEGFE